MTRIGIIGSGSIGVAVARLAVANEIDVQIANSRGPETLGTVVEELGSRAVPSTVADAAGFGDFTVLAIPLSAYSGLPRGLLRDRSVLSTGNYYPSRDGRIEALDSLALTTAEYEQSLLGNSSIVKAFNNIVAHQIPLLADSRPRTALAVAGDSADIKLAAMRLVDTLGFDPVDAGSLEESWRFEPESGAYTDIYFAGTGGDDYLNDPGRPVDAGQLRQRLVGSTRAVVQARRF